MRKTLKRALVLVLYYSGFNFLCGALMGHRLYLVGYHNISDAKDPSAFAANEYPKVTIRSDVFEQHLAYLKKNGHTFVRLEDILSGNFKNVPKPTLIYFDDGFKTVEAHAMPILRRSGAPAAVFVTSGIADRLPELLSADPKLDEVYLSWDDMRGMLKAGDVSFGAHGRVHAKMTACSPAELSQELSEPRERLLKEIGARTDALAYPHGRVNDAVEAVAKKTGYQLAITSVEGSNGFSSLEKRPLRLKKIAPKPYDDLLMFKVKVYSWNLVLSLSRLWS